MCWSHAGLCRRDVLLLLFSTVEMNEIGIFLTCTTKLQYVIENQTTMRQDDDGWSTDLVEFTPRSHVLAVGCRVRCTCA